VNQKYLFAPESPAEIAANSPLPVPQKIVLPAGIKPYYEESGITIINADCRHVLPRLPKVDLCLCDPPYGINAANMHEDSGRHPGRSLAPKRNYPMTTWDDVPPSKETLAMVIAAGKNAILWGGNYFGLGASRCVLVWDKVNGENAFADCELAWTNLDKPVRLKRHMWNGMLRENGEYRYDHPTQKPLELMLWCIQQVPECRTIIDPFCGTGTTLVAAKLLGRAAIGIEIDQHYCDISIERLSQGVIRFEV
jgi:DNA modification methylase